MRYFNEEQLHHKAAGVEQALKTIGPKLPAEVVEAFTAAYAASVAAAAAVQSLKAQIIAASHERNQRLEAVHEGIKSARAAVVAKFGDNSTEFEQVGGTRREDRKRPRRKPEASTPVVAPVVAPVVTPVVAPVVVPEGK